MTCEDCNKPLPRNATSCQCGWKESKVDGVDLSGKVPVDVGGRTVWMDKPRRSQLTEEQALGDSEQAKARQNESSAACNAIITAISYGADRGSSEMAALAEKFPDNARGFVALAKDIQREFKGADDDSGETRKSKTES